MSGLVLAVLAGLASPVAHALSVDAGPSVQVSWKGSRGSLEVVPAPGTYLQETAPVSGWWEIGPTRTELRATGAELVDGLALDLPSEQRGLRGELSVPVCDEGGTACRLVDVGFAGSLRGKKGRGVELAPWAPEAVEQPVAEAAPVLSMDAAMAQAQIDGKPVLIDFGAVWCPPCNRLAAEILDDPEDAAALDGFRLVKVDVDEVASWKLKDRYAVGGYPTVVVVDARGEELDRFVGYTSEAGWLAWLSGVSSLPPVSDLPAPDELSGQEAAAIGLRLARVGKELEAGPFLIRAASEGAHDAAYHEARVHLKPKAEDVLWLVEQGSPDLLLWVWPALELASEDESVRTGLLGAVRVAMADADPVDLADLLYCVGSLTEGDESRAAYLTAARTLANSLSGDAEQDRGHWSGLAQLWEKAGLAERGEALLVDAIAEYPEEFTFHYALAGLQLRQGQDAVAVAEAALSHAYGDNALRAADRLAKALIAQDRSEEATELLEKTLAEADRPDEGVDVRTPRYLGVLETTLASIR